MQRYRRAARWPWGMGLLLAAGGCSVPSQRENVDVTARLVSPQVGAPLEWRLDAEDDAAALKRAEAVLGHPLSMQDAITIAFLASPELQLALEKLEISRTELVAAMTPPNPVVVAGSRQPGGDLAAFYPDRSISVGVLQNVIGLLNIPDRRAIARRDLERARYEAANAAIRHAALVAQAWFDYSAALQVQVLRERGMSIVRLAYDNLRARPGIPPETLATQRNVLLAEQTRVVIATQAAVKARAKLGEELGIAGWQDSWSIEATLPSLPAEDPDVAEIERLAMERRYDLQAASRAVDARLRVLATQKRFRWLNQLDIGVFRDKVAGGTSFTGPNMVIELPLFDQRQSRLLNADAMLRTEVRRLQVARLAARSEIRSQAADVVAARHLVEHIEREVQPAQLQQRAVPGGSDPDDTRRMRLLLDSIGTDADHTDRLREYWRARSALALAAGDWSALSGLR